MFFLHRKSNIANLIICDYWEGDIMKKLFLFVFVGILLGINVAHGVETREMCIVLANDQQLAGITYTRDDSCYADNANSVCKDITTGEYTCTGSRTLLPNRYGIEATNHFGVEQQFTTNPDGVTGTVTCVCNRSVRTTYACASGYYGTATGSTSGCTACPDNATCAGGNSSTFMCAAGYYKNSSGDGCSACPPDELTGKQTSAAGASAVTDCYVPATATWTDDKGTKKFTAKCNYSL